MSANVAKKYTKGGRIPLIAAATKVPEPVEGPRLPYTPSAGAQSPPHLKVAMYTKA